MRKLFNVSCEIAIDAESAEDAMQKIRYFLSGDYDVDINFLVHSAEADESFEDIEALRNHQAVEHTLAPDKGQARHKKGQVVLPPAANTCPLDV